MHELTRMDIVPCKLAHEPDQCPTDGSSLTKGFEYRPPQPGNLLLTIGWPQATDVGVETPLARGEKRTSYCCSLTSTHAGIHALSRIISGYVRVWGRNRDSVLWSLGLIG